MFEKMNRVQVKQALNLNSNEHVSSPKTVVKQVKVGVMNSPGTIDMITKKENARKSRHKRSNRNLNDSYVLGLKTRSCMQVHTPCYHLYMFVVIFIVKNVVA